MLSSGHKVVPINTEEQAKQNREFKAYEMGLIRLQPDGWFFLKSFTKYADKLYNFQFLPSDVLIMTYPKCGTTWTQEIVWTMRNNPDLDNPLAKIDLDFRSPFMDFDFLWDNPYIKTFFDEDPLYQEFSKVYPGRSSDDGMLLQMAELVPQPRTLKTHLPFSLFPKDLLEKCKIIYVARNPKDVCYSYYHHSKLINTHDFVGSLEEFVAHFVNDTLIFGPFWTHIKEAWCKRTHPNMHFIFFEDMKFDPKSEIRRLDKFLNSNLTEKQMDNVIGYTSFSQMKARADSSLERNIFYNDNVLKESGGFYRKGEVGDGKKKLTKKQEEKIDLWTKENTMGSNLKFRI